MHRLFSLFFRRVHFFALCLFAPGLHAAELASPDVGVDLSLRYQTQQYSDRDASLWSATLSPYLIYDSWILGIDIPYQRVNGVFNFRGTAQQERNCNLVTQGSPLPPILEPYRDRILARCQALTQENNTEDGVGDLNVYASYGRGIGDESWYMLWTLGYDGDNADQDRQLGSGTRDMYMDLVLTQDQPDYSLLFLAGYNYLLGGAYEDLYESYSYVGGEISSARGKPWVFGAGLDYQYDSIEPIASVRLFGHWQVMDSLKLKLQLKGYEDSVYYPNSSVDASLLVNF